MTDRTFQEPPLKLVQRHIAWAAVAPTTLRGMLEIGGRQRVCTFLSELDLSTLGTGSVSSVLDRWTNDLASLLGNRWGPARKAINLFLRDATASYRLREAFGLGKIERDLELPLDGIVMDSLRKIHPGARLPRSTVVALSPQNSAAYQRVAEEVAARNQVTRVDLDLWLWQGDKGGAQLL